MKNNSFVVVFLRILTVGTYRSVVVKLEVATPWGSFVFFLASRELLIKIFKIISKIYISYLKPFLS